MNDEIEPKPEDDAERSRIVRAIYDAAEELRHATDERQIAEARQAICRLQMQVDALADRDFSTAFQAALRLLVPPATGEAT